MTIRQQGGIFGRNPKFNDVEANDVTATDVSASTGSFSTSLSSGGVSASSYASTASDFVTGGTSGQSGMTLVGDPASQTNIFFADGTSGGAVAAGYIIYSHAGGSMLVGVENNTAFTVNSSGNLAFPSGQGIDFSATSGTGTSELFDDYEEGTWTPAFSGVTVTHTSQSGTYTKIGRMVYVTAAIEVSSIDNTDTSGVEISGLPFAASGTIALNWTKNYAGNPLANIIFDTSPITAAPANSTFIQLRRVNTAASSNTGSRYVDLFNASGQIQFTAWYYTA